MRRIAIIAAILGAGLGALALRVVLEGRAALADGDAARARDQPLTAIRAYETAARWYLPFAPHVDDAYDRLRALTKLQQTGAALAAWRAIRGAARATRHVWQPHASDLAAADAAIAELSARDPDAGPAGDTTASREAWYASRLARDPRPGTGAAALAGVGIALWVLGALALARWGVTASGGLARRPAAIAAASILLGLVSWAVGLYNA